MVSDTAIIWNNDNTYSHILKIDNKYKTVSGLKNFMRGREFKNLLNVKVEEMEKMLINESINIV